MNAKKGFDDTPADQQEIKLDDKEVEKMIAGLLLIGLISGENPIEKMMENRDKEE